jgi:3-methyladenine DNA glycosylase AlkD
VAHHDSDLVHGVRVALMAAGDREQAAGMRAYMKSELPFRGIPSPLLRAILTPLLAAHDLYDERTWRASILELWDQAAFREERYAALALARHRRYRAWRRPSTLPLYAHLIRSGGWWDLVDEIATHLVREQLLAEPEEVAPVVRAWAVDENRWVRRTAIICQVGAQEQVDQDLLAETIEANLDGSTRTGPPLSPHGRDFFVRKAIGWALRDHARTDPDWVRSFVADHEDRLAGLSRREALRVIGG